MPTALDGIFIISHAMSRLPPATADSNINALVAILNHIRDDV
jgi:hypothetical protein